MTIPPVPLVPPSAALQNLPPAAARFCLNLLRFLTKELGVNPVGKRLLVAFSGGADSTALLLALRALATKGEFSLAAAHLDHALRPSSREESDYCRSLCEKLGVTFIARRQDVGALAAQNGCGIEEAAREARYAFLAKASRTVNAHWIALGHTGNDLMEDVLMRLMRGTGWPALAGMPAIDKRRALLRPLLLTRREAIEHFLHSLGVGWLTDESNEDERWLRNRIRKNIAPLILRENPAFPEVLAGLWRLGRVDENYFSGLLDTLPSACQSPDAHGSDAAGLFMPRKELAALPKALRLRLHKRMLDALGPGQARLDGLLALDASFMANDEPTEHRFPGAKRARVEKKGITWLPGKSEK